MVDRTVAPEFVQLKNADVPVLKKQLLDNGIPFYYFQSLQQKVVKIELIFQAGKWHEWVHGSSYFTAKMLKSGSQRYTSRQINDYLDKYGAFTEFSSSQDDLTLEIYCLSRYLEEILLLIADLLNNSIFPNMELLEIKEQDKSDLQVNLKRTAYLARVLFQKKLFGETHPYGRSNDLLVIDQISEVSIVDFYDKKIRGNLFTIVASGDISDKTIKLVNSIFGNFTVNKEIYSHDVPKISTQVGSFYEGVEQSVQSSLVIGKIMPGRKHGDIHKIAVVNEILGGYFGSRLMKTIREEKGYTYGIHSRLVHLKNYSYLAIMADVIKEKREESIAAINIEINKLITGGISFDELNRVKNHMTGAFLSAINSPFTIASLFKILYAHELDYSYFNDFLGAINTISEKEVIEIAENYFFVESFTEVSAG